MTTTTATRRLAAILAADVVGYSRLMGADEEGTHERLKAHLRQLIDPKIKEHRGHIVKNTGDGMLAEFASVVDAVLLDNMTPETMRRAVGMVDGRAITEASGRINLETAPIIAAAGVDLISSGWITHSAPILDLGLDVT